MCTPERFAAVSRSVTRLGAAVCALAAIASCAVSPAGSTSPGAVRYGIGRAPTAAEIRGWDIDVVPSGAGLPVGSGSVARGRTVYVEQCAACHGAEGRGQTAPALAGGTGSLATAKPIATIGSFWPYATTLYDYINRSMPFDRPQSLAPDDVYAVTAYVLHVNGLLGADATLDAASLPKVRMPNARGFVPVDPRPDTAGAACMRDCR